MRRTYPVSLLAILIIALVAAAVSTGASPPKSETIAVFFSPKGGCTEAVVRELNAAQKSVRIQAYSFTSTTIAKAILDAKKRGVKVEALLDKSNRSGKYSSATFLKNQGCDVLIDAKHAIAHNKIMIIDEKVIMTGSFNFTKAAEESNAENLLVIRDQPTLVEKYLANFALHQKHCEEYTGLEKGKADAQMDQPDEEAKEGDEAVKAKFVGSKNSDIYHYPGCSAAKKISPQNLVNYDAAPEGKKLHAGCPK